MTMTALVQYAGSCVVDDNITGIYVKQTVVLTLVRRRYQFVRPGTHQCQQFSWISTCCIQHNNKWLHTTTVFKNTSFEWTTSSNYIFIN